MGMAVERDVAINVAELLHQQHVPRALEELVRAVRQHVENRIGRAGHARFVGSDALEQLVRRRVLRQLLERPDFRLPLRAPGRERNLAVRRIDDAPRDVDIRLRVPDDAQAAALLDPSARRLRLLEPFRHDGRGRRLSKGLPTPGSVPMPCASQTPEMSGWPSGVRFTGAGFGLIRTGFAALRGIGWFAWPCAATDAACTDSPAATIITMACLISPSASGSIILERTHVAPFFQIPA